MLWLIRDLMHLRWRPEGRSLAKKYVSILLWTFAFIWNYPMRLVVLVLALVEYVANAFSSNYSRYTKN